MECIREARNNGSYIDQTGNLRSSIGYAVLRNGAMYSKSDFASVKNGHDGSTTGNEFINELSKEYSGGLVLIVVAGMEYAAYVSTKRNVLASAEILALQLVPSLLSKLGFTK